MWGYYSFFFSFSSFTMISIILDQTRRVDLYLIFPLFYYSFFFFWFIRSLVLFPPQSNPLYFLVYMLGVSSGGLSQGRVSED